MLIFVSILVLFWDYNFCFEFSFTLQRYQLVDLLLKASQISHIHPPWKNTTVLRPFIWDYPGELIPEETFTHPPSWSSSNHHRLLPSTVIHSILPVQIMCLTVFLYNLCPHPLWSTCWSGALHLIFHTFFHPVIVFFLQHMPIPSLPVLL